MTPDTIPAPPPGWAIVPADDARLDCLPDRPMYWFTGQPLWHQSDYGPGDKVEPMIGVTDAYALPVEPAQAWSLPAPPAGQAWHRQDWTAEMLPEGWRPLLAGECRQKGDEFQFEGDKGWLASQVHRPPNPHTQEFYRTRRPLPASQPEQASPAEDEVVIWNLERGPIQPGTDPKGEAGKAKAPLALLPPEALRQAAWAHALGAAKYGVANWRENNVNATTYVSAMMRHIGQYLDGEDADAESGLSHLAHVIASANILIDAKHCGTLVDDRPKRPA